MINDLIFMGGHGLFVWSAFIFTFVCCVYLYARTAKELKKQEKIYLNSLKKLPELKIIEIKKQKLAKQILAHI